MSISPVNLIIKNSYTDNGNKYKKSNAGKTFATGTIALGGNHILNSTAKAFNQKTPASSKVGMLIIGAIMGLGLGTIIDGIINTVNANIADKKAANAHGDTFESSSRTPENTTKIASHQG